MMKLVLIGHWMLAVFGEELESAGPEGPAECREEVGVKLLDCPSGL